MTLRTLLIVPVVALGLGLTAAAQRPVNAPATGPGGTPPDTVFLEELTWAETRDLVKAGWTTVIVGTAGTEQKGPHMVDGEHKFVMTWAADKIARGVGKTLVAPVVTYVPEGSWETVTGHMGKPGTITLPEERFVDLLVHAGRSLKAGGFTTVMFIGESGGNRTGMRTAAEKLNTLWGGSAKALWIDDYYTKAHRDQEQWAAKFLGVPPGEVGNHANILDTSELLFIAPQHIRADRLSGNDYENNGVSGNNQSKSSPEVGRALMQIKVDNALAQIKRMTSGAEGPVPARAPAGRRRGRRGSGAGGNGANRGTTPADHAHGARRQDADASARHGVHRRADLGRNPRPDEGGEDDGDRAHRRHREERVSHGARQAQLRGGLRRQSDGAEDRQHAGGAGDSVRAGG